MLIHLNLKPYKCELCGAAFRSGYQVSKHKRGSHVPTGAFRCSDCSCQFESHSGLNFHISQRHSPHPPKERPISVSRKFPQSPLRKPFLPVLRKNGYKVKFKFLPPLPRLLPMPKKEVEESLETTVPSSTSNATESIPVKQSPTAQVLQNVEYKDGRPLCTICGKTFGTLMNLKYVKEEIIFI
jgi:hypothetical protein